MDTKHRGKNYFLTGLITILPLALSVYILWIIFNFIGQRTSPIFHKLFALMNITYFPFLVTVFSVVLTIILVWFIGVIATNFIGRRILHMLENVVTHIPILKGFYSSIRQLITHMFNDKDSFRQVVLIEYPRNGIYSIGFLTNDTWGEVQEKTNEKVMSVFIPTTPNPTSGVLVMVPEKHIIKLSMTIDEGIKFVISGGIVIPGFKETASISAKENV